MKFFAPLTALFALVSAQAPSVEVAATAANLTALIDAINSVDLTSTVLGLEKVTIFAPTNAAFDAVTAFANSANLTITPELLTSILQLHIVPGVFLAADVIKAAPLNATTVLKDAKVFISVKDGKVYVAGEGNSIPATVVVADVLIKQGVVHVIDTVLLPSLSGPATTTSAPGATGTAKTSVASMVGPSALLGLVALVF